MNTCRRVSVLVSLWAFLSSAPVAGQELQKIKIGYPAISYNQIHIWVAKEAGLFKKYGLDTELIFLRGGQMATQALVAGDPPLVNIGTVVQAVLQGHDLTLIAASENAYAYSVVAAPGVARIDMLNLGIEVQGNGLATTRSFINRNRATVKAALKGYVEAIHYIHKNKEETKKVMAKYLRDADPEVTDAAYQGFVKMVPKRPYPTLKGIQFLLDELSAELPQARGAKPEQFVDLSLLQELEREGFFAEMAQRYP